MTNNKISNKIKYIYFILTIGMVMYHSRWIDDFNIKPLNRLDELSLSLYVKIAEHIGFVCMVFFFFMSAFWLYKGLETQKDVIKKMKKRIKTLLIPFLIWTLILGLYKVCFCELIITKNNIFYHLFETPVAGPLWYILGLLILQLFAPIVITIKKRKKLTTTLFITVITYISLRSLNVIPKLLVFEKWWWYNNLIFYTPVYMIGAYIGMYYPDILLQKEYNSKKYTYIGTLLLLLVFLLWNFLLPDIYFTYIIYSIIDVIGIWFILKPRFCSKNIPDFLNCGFYIYALHNPVLIPITGKIIGILLNNRSIFSIEVILIKIIQISIIVIVSAIIKKIASKIFSEEFNYYLTGGR